MTHDPVDPEIVDAGDGSPVGPPSHPPDMAPLVASPLAADSEAASGGIGAAPAGGAGRAPVPRGLRGRRASVGRRVAVVVAVVMVAALGVPVVWLLRDVVKGTVEADRGTADPVAAVVEYFGAGPLGGFGADDIRFGHVLCKQGRDALRAQASGISADVQRAAANHGAALLHVETSDDQITVDGDRASVTTLVSLVFSTSEPGAPFFVGSKHAWTFGLVNDGGWRVCEVTAPVICGVVLNCDLPPAGTGVPTPTPPRGALPVGRGVP